MHWLDAGGLDLPTDNLILSAHDLCEHAQHYTKNDSTNWGDSFLASV